jgi:hypothetical protein
MHVKRIILAAILLTSPGFVRAQFDFKLADRTFHVYSFASQGFAYSNDNNYLTMKTSKGSFALTDFGFCASSQITDKLKGVFLITKTSLNDGSHVELVLMKGGAVHEAFLKENLGKTDSSLQVYYRSLVFTGKGSMLKILGNDAEVAAYVAKTKGAIGYMSSEVATAGVKVLEEK